MNICIYGSASNDIDKCYISETEKLAEMLAERGHSLVFGAGNAGLMGASARGFHKHGAKITGVAPSFFNVDGILYPNCDELIRTDTMRTRKQKMDDLADAFITAPGGIGTYEEFFEIITLRQLGQSKRPLAVFNINGYFDCLHQLLENCVKGNFMPEASLKLCFFSDSKEELINYIENYKAEDYNLQKLRNITVDESK